LFAVAHDFVYPASLSSLPPTYIAVLPKDPSTSLAYTYSQLSSGASYHLGATLELGNDVLNGDVDSTAGFNGAHSTCGGTTGDDLCFDVLPE
jgi:hypothetical protein